MGCDEIVERARSTPAAEHAADMTWEQVIAMEEFLRADVLHN
jgi:hypothetical protein